MICGFHFFISTGSLGERVSKPLLLINTIYKTVSTIIISTVICRFHGRTAEAVEARTLAKPYHRTIAHVALFCVPRAMATAPRVTLEQHDAPVVLKFDQSSGKTEAVRGELDPPAKRSIGHFLREEVVQSKRQKGSEVEATSDRVRMLRELQEMALEGAQKASQVASLLGDPWGDQQVRFLQLHPFTPKKMDWDQVSRSLEETMNAVPGRIEGILEARNRLTPALPELLAQMEAAIGFLGHRWPIHSSLGHHAVELARPETVADMMPRALVRVSNNPKRGVTLSFPWEISLLVQPRKELFVSLRSQTLGEGSSQSSANSSLAGLGEMLRPEALHEALFGAQRLLVDASIFEGLRKGLSKTDCKAQWTLRRAASNEIAFMAARP